MTPELRKALATIRSSILELGAQGAGIPEHDERQALEIAALDRISAALEATASAQLDAKLQALVDMHHTSMRHRKYGREPERLGATFTELRNKYESEATDGS